MKTIRIIPFPEKSFDIDRKIFGSFIEHIENCIDGGIMDPGHPMSDVNGIRLDVADLCSELKPSIIRFPGGTVIGIYHWQDHVGPIGQRKRMRNLIWGGMLTESFGTCEFIAYCRRIGAEPMLCVNMPSGTPEEAANWVEYCNGTGHTYYADLRRSHGYEEPFHVRYWCIGNESYAVPDLGCQNDVNTYTREAWEYIKYMKLTDPGIETVLVGDIMNDDWNRAVLDSAGAVCDFLSFHSYASSRYALSQISEMNGQTVPRLRALLQSYNEKPVVLDRWYRFPPRRHDIYISLDEWNIWDCTADDLSPYGLRQRYSWHDALWTASFLNMLIRNGDIIRIANLAQMVNVLAPIIADRDGAWKQTIFYPFSLYAGECHPVYIYCETERSEQLDLVLTGNGHEYRLFTVNTGLDEIMLELPQPASAMRILTADRPDAPNTEETDHVRIEDGILPGTEKAVLPPESVCMIVMQLSAQ